MKFLPIFIALLAAASAVPCDSVPGLSCSSKIKKEVVSGGTTTTVKKVSTSFTESVDGVTTNVSGAVNIAPTTAANAALAFFKTKAKLLNTVTAIDAALSVALVALVQNVDQVGDKLSGCIKPVTNNIAQITTEIHQLTSTVVPTTPTSIHQNIDQITRLLSSVDQSFEVAYKNIGETSQIIQGAINEVSQTIQQFIIVQSSTVEQTPESIIKSAVNVGYAVNQLVIYINQVTNQINFNSASTGVIESVNSLPVGLAQIFVVVLKTVMRAAKSMNESSEVQEALYVLASTISTGVRDVTPILNQINKSLNANDGAVYGLTQNYSYLISSLKITKTNMSSNLNTLLGDLNININEVPARYLSVELGSVINQCLVCIKKLVKSGTGYAKIIVKGFPIFGNLYIELNSSVSELMNYIANISASNLSGDAIQILRSNILSSTNGLTNQISKIMAAAESELTGIGKAVLINIAENSQSLVTDLVINVNTLASNLSVSVNLDVLLGKFFSTLTTKSLAATEYSQYIAKFKHYKFD